MTQSRTRSDAIERTRRAISVAGFTAIVSCLLVGLALAAAEHPFAAGVFTVAASLLVAMPLTGVTAVVAVEIRRRDWGFAAIGVAVLLLIAWNLRKLLF